MNIEQAITRFIVDELLLGASSVEIEPETPLVSSRILDSLALLRMVTFLEERFNITIEDGELIPENFETVGMIARMIEAKQPAT